jgi:hypothetical protein
MMFQGRRARYSAAFFLFTERFLMSTSESHRISGVLVAWRLSKGGGFGRVIANEQSYFICRRFIVEGLPIVGSPLTFEIAPPLPGKLFPQASNAKINNRQIVRAMNMPRLVRDENGAADLSRAVSILTGASDHVS